MSSDSSFGSDGRNTIVLTFDDAVKENQRALRLLDRYNMRATFFLDTARIGREMSEETIRNASQWNEIGSHTVSHPDLSKLPLTSVKRELEQSKEYLERILDEEVVSFAYPYGKYNSRVLGAVRYYYKWARTTVPFMKSKDRYRMGVTLWAYPHAYRHILKMVRFLGVKRSVNLIPLVKKWDLMILRVLETGVRVIHILIHSRFIEERSEWEKLEAVLSELSSYSARNLTFGEYMAEIFEVDSNEDLSDS